MNFFNASKNKTWLSKNYFFAGTAVVIAVNVLLFVIGGGGWQEFVWADAGPSVYVGVYGNIRAFLNCFAHGSVWQLLFAVSCFSVCGLRLERKTGTVKWLLLVFAMAFLTSSAAAANYLSVQFSGFSVVVYGLFAYMTVDNALSLAKERKNRANAISCAALTLFIYIAMCFDGSSFSWYPRGLIYNLGHYSGFLAGLVFGLTIQIFNLRDTGKAAWLTKNLFFAGTAALVLAMVLLFAFGGDDWQGLVEAGGPAGFTSPFYFNPTVRAFFNAFAHLDWVHVLFNTGGLLVCGMHLERKTGSVKFISAVLMLAYFTAAVSVASTFTAVTWIGFSGALYLLYAYVAVDYLFMLRKTKRNRRDIFLGAAALACIYAGMSFRGVVFMWYPYSLFYHAAHLAGFAAGAALGTAAQLSKALFEP